MPTTTWAPESLVVSRMKVRGSRLDPLLCRQRLSRLLDEADITLEGLSPIGHCLSPPRPNDGR
jgi:hypothetical protein